MEMSMKKSVFFFCLLLVALVTRAQILEPVTFKTELKKVSDEKVEIVFTGRAS